MNTKSQFACLAYHVIGERGNQYEVSAGQLHAQLAFLNEEGYVVEGFEQLEARLRSGRGIPARYVLLSADDGHQSAMGLADALEKYTFRATFFLTRDFSLKRHGFLPLPEIRELRRRGFSLGTHGTTHRALAFLPEDCCIVELKEAREWLEDVLGEQVRYMSSPGGFINRRVAKLTYKQGYVLTGTCNEWVNSPETMALPCTVNCVSVRRHFSLKSFRHIVEGHPGFYTWRQVRALALWIPKQILRPPPNEQVANPLR